jgi:hypothetical protein
MSAGDDSHSGLTVSPRLNAARLGSYPTAGRPPAAHRPAEIDGLIRLAESRHAHTIALGGGRYTSCQAGLRVFAEWTPVRSRCAPLPYPPDTRCRSRPCVWAGTGSPTSTYAPPATSTALRSSATPSPAVPHAGDGRRALPRVYSVRARADQRDVSRWLAALRSLPRVGRLRPVHRDCGAAAS